VGLRNAGLRLTHQGRAGVIQLDVIRRCPARLKAYGLADNKRNGLGLGFAYCLGGGCATLGLRSISCACLVLNISAFSYVVAARVRIHWA
jgi:hypothetical protein